MQQILEIFHSTRKKRLELGQKTDFLADFMSIKLRPNCYTKLKSPWRYKMMVSFISIAFVVSKL